MVIGYELLVRGWKRTEGGERQWSVVRVREGIEGIPMVHSYQTAFTCGYSIIFLSFVKSVKL